MPDQIEYNASPAPDAFVLRSKEMDLEAGWLGRCFGGRSNAPLNIAGLLVVLLLGSGIAVLFVQNAMGAADYWKTIVPLITLVMGYVFGKGGKE